MARPPDHSAPAPQPNARKLLGTLTQSERNASGSGADLYEDGVTLELFVDGGHQVMVGPAVTRLLLHKVENIALADGVSTAGGLIESRRAVATLVMPTQALLQLCAVIMQSVQVNSASLVQALDAQRAALSGFPPLNPTILTETPERKQDV